MSRSFPGSRRVFRSDDPAADLLDLRRLDHAGPVSIRMVDSRARDSPGPGRRRPSAGESGPSRVSGVLVRQGSNQAQELPLLWTQAGAQELADLDMPAGGDVGLVADEHLAGRIPDQIPVVAEDTMVSELGSALRCRDCNWTINRGDVHIYRADRPPAT